MSLLRLLLLGLGKILARPVRRHLNAFEAATHHPQEVQEALLRRILARQAGTGYDYFEPYIARVCKGDFNALLADQHVHMFALTSGTTAARKYIPVTDQYLADYRRGWNIWGLKA